MRHTWRICVDHADPLAAVLLTGLAAVFLGVAGQLGSMPGSICVLGFCGVVVVRQQWPIPAALVAGVLIAVPQFAHDAFTANDNGTFLACWAVIFLFSYTLGASAPFPLSLVGVAAILVGVNLSSGGFNPVPEMVAFGPYAGGLAVASRRKVSAQLELRAKELEEEQEIFSQESVRYERARIARELHDIVAHSVSLMVVQANAGERMATRDPQRAAEAFATIGEAARQAEMEIQQLVDFLGDQHPASPSAGLRIVEELVARVEASGLSISCTLSGDIEQVSDQGADTAYRLVQESITNAMKHAPGSAIVVAVEGRPTGIELRVVNGPSLETGSGLERSGGGHGLPGLRTRILNCGGSLFSGPTAEGGWCVNARIPRQPGPGPGPGDTAT
jgi:signal transduction histidine kinase